MIIGLPPDDVGTLGFVGNVGWKWHWQREILRRKVTDTSKISCIWGDESSLWISPSDTAFLSRCRSYRGCMVYICQSIESYRHALPGEKSKSAVEAMLSNFSQKLIFSLGDSTTAQWAADLCGKELRFFTSGSVQHPEYEPLRLFPKPALYTSSFSEQFEYLIQPASFMSGMRTGGPANRYLVDALLIRPGALFSNGYPVTQVIFNQREKWNSNRKKTR